MIIMAAMLRDRLSSEENAATGESESLHGIK